MGMNNANKTNETAVDSNASECVGCKGTRCEYRCYGGVARMRCLKCKRLVAIDVAASVTRLWKGWTVDQKREWFARAYG